MTNPRPYITILPNGKPVDALEPHEVREVRSMLDPEDLPYLRAETYAAIGASEVYRYEASEVYRYDCAE